MKFRTYAKPQVGNIYYAEFPGDKLCFRGDVKVTEILDNDNIKCEVINCSNEDIGQRMIWKAGYSLYLVCSHKAWRFTKI
jgi:hypothetical protein